MKKSLLRGLLALLALAMLFCFVGCSSSHMRASANADDVVATAGEIEILYDEYYALAMTKLRELKAEHGENALSDPAIREELADYIASNLCSERQALLAIGLSLGIDIEDDKIADNVDKHMEGILEETFSGDSEKYVESLRQDYLTDRYVRMIVAVENYLSVEIIKALLENGTLNDSDEEALARINNKDEFARVRQVVIKEIVGQDGKVILSLDAAKQKTEELRASVLAATTNTERDAAMFDAMGESHDISDTGYGIYFARGEMEKEYEDLVFDLPLYGVSEVYEVEGGYAFTMRLEMDQQYVQANLENLKGKTYYIVLNQMTDKWLEENPLVMTALGESLNVENLEAIEPDSGVGVLVILFAVLGALVIVGIFVIRVLWLRSRVKKGKPIGAKKKKAKK